MSTTVPDWVRKSTGEPLPRGLATALTRLLAYKTAMHLIGKHADPMAVARSWPENADQHRHEHDGPGTIRNHPRHDLGFDPEKVEQVLEEAEEDL